VTDDPYAAGACRVEEALLRTTGALPVELRQAVAARTRGEAAGELPADVAGLADTIARHAYRTTDEQVAGLVERHGEDAVLELTLAAASGAARVRLDAALRALGEAP
jgi:hypothetical protein